MTVSQTIMSFIRRIKENNKDFDSLKSYTQLLNKLTAQLVGIKARYTCRFTATRNSD